MTFMTHVSGSATRLDTTRVGWRESLDFIRSLDDEIEFQMFLFFLITSCDHQVLRPKDFQHAEVTVESPDDGNDSIMKAKHAIVAIGFFRLTKNKKLGVWNSEFADSSCKSS